MEFKPRIIEFLCSWCSYTGADLAVRLVPAQGSEELSRMLGVQRDTDGCFSELDYCGSPTDIDKGGVCVAACPSSAIKGSHFTGQQVLAQVDVLFCV